MAGIENILDIIASQQKQTEDSIILAAKKKASEIEAEYKVRADREYEEYLKKSMAKLEQEYKNGESSVDGEMKRKILAYKVVAIDETVENALRKLDSMPDNEYFAVLEKLLAKHLQHGNGVLQMNRRDLARLPESFGKSAAELAEKAGGTVTVSDKAADIENGFILTYGLISENCSFRAIIEAERDGVRDTAAKALFGQVS
ncbi:MAG: H(+)-transporting ATPase [Ruminococcus sp.]|nr:H(+)-transporting ATPase [Ruminococcus sp.]